MTGGVGLAYTTAQTVIVAYDLANRFEAEIISYSSLSGSFSLQVKSSTGGGTYSLWSINLNGAPGQSGSSGSSGTSGTSGTSGIQGVTGAAGSPGVTGATGTVDESLLIAYTVVFGG